MDILAPRIAPARGPPLREDCVAQGADGARRVPSSNRIGVNQLSQHPTTRGRSPLERARQQAAQDCARRVIETHPLCNTTGATSPYDHVVVVRVLSPLGEPATDLLRRVWSMWRQQLWQLAPQLPRIWAT